MENGKLLVKFILRDLKNLRNNLKSDFRNNTNHINIKSEIKIIN